ncbi:hypothetical protein RFI_22795 [Reticulomyxa filosa]|uniref:Kelch motif family protein n=1 Tax=Reticulomyxa filosa TaxID=46433 RepID=X6MKN1_RETFI|nr:hypothetical protein RFI_22795 [Reticulomyxa filosa]|eukprot:ETO14573.1 hypothetical protein RFI_22795 [Reticulomyxa filosa]
MVHILSRKKKKFKNIQIISHKKIISKTNKQKIFVIFYAYNFNIKKKETTCQEKILSTPKNIDFDFFCEIIKIWNFLLNLTQYVFFLSELKQNDLALFLEKGYKITSIYLKNVLKIIYILKIILLMIIIPINIDLPITLYQTQCVSHKHELLLCGGYYERACYSYHKIKNEYKFICEYPSNIKLMGHCVVKLIDNNNNNKNRNQITLLSFGGAIKHTFVMKYISVWSNTSNELNNCNQWIPFTYNNNHPIMIGRDGDNYWGARAVIGGSNNHLLFVTYYQRDISVFNLNTFQFIKHDTLPTTAFRCINYHCFVSRTENEQGQEMMKTNKQNYQMFLFHKKIGLSIEYDEDNNTFQFHQLSIGDDIAPFYHCAYICINNVILFFGGYGWKKIPIVSKSVHKYSIPENKWIIFENTLPNPLHHCVATLNEEDNHIHIIGGKDNEYTKSKKEIKFIIQHWIRILKIKLGWIDDFDKIIMKYSI